MPEAKYVVVKSEDFEALLVGLKNSLTPEVGEAMNNFCTALIDDAVVIRRQDVFAPPALDAYANNINVTVTAMREMRPTDFKVINRLTEIADYFHEQATQAWLDSKKLPD